MSSSGSRSGVVIDESYQWLITKESPAPRLPIAELVPEHAATCLPTSPSNRTLRGIEFLQGIDGVHATSWLDKRPRRHAGVASRLETAARVDLRRIPVSGRRPRLRAGIARIPGRHRHHQCMVVVDALPVPVRGRGLAVDGEAEGVVLDDDGVG